MLFEFTPFTLYNVKKSNLLPIQAREGLRVISGCIFLFTGMWAYNWGAYKWG